MNEIKTEQKVKFKKSKVEIALYVAAIIMAALGIFMLYSSYMYIADYTTMYGMSITDMLGDTIQYILTQCFPYFAFAVITAGVGAVYGQLAPQMIFEIAENNAETACQEAEFSDAEADEVANDDEAFEEAVCVEAESFDDCAACEAESCEGCEKAAETAVDEDESKGSTFTEAE